MQGLSKRHAERRKRLFPLAVFAGGCVLVVAVHPDRFTGWALWALSPLFFQLAYLLAFRMPPRRARMVTASVAATGYSALYVLVAGLGDESYRDVGQLVYVLLPALGVCSMFACLVVIEVSGALRVLAFRSRRTKPRGDALPVGRALAVAAVVMGGWAIVASTGWDRSELVVAEARAGAPDPFVARVRCEGEDTHLLTPRVVAQADGVHVRVDNPHDGDIWLEYEIDGGSGGGGGALLPHGASEHVIRIPAASIGVVCHEQDRSSPGYAAMTVVRLR